MPRVRFLHIGCLAGVIFAQACTTLPTNASDADRSTTPIVVSGAYTKVAAGFVHTCALDASGAAFCWGSNDYSQLGVSLTAHTCGGRPCSKTPVEVNGNLRFRSLAAGWVHNCGVGTDTFTYCWGGGAVGGQGYLGDGALTRSATPVRVLADSAFAALTIGDGHSCALTASGMAFCWGQNIQGQLGDGTRGDRALPVAVKTALRFRAVSAGAYHTCGLTLGNEAYCWGDNRWGQLGIGDVAYNSVSSTVTQPSPVVGGAELELSSIAAGWEHTCAASTSGVAYCWGRNEIARQLGDESNVTHRGTPWPVAGNLRFATLDAGALATCGRTASDDVYCWGANYYGGLGNGASVSDGVGHPVRTLGGPYAQVTIGQSHACGLATDRRLWCWGDQSAAQF